MEYQVQQEATGPVIQMKGPFTIRDHDRFFEIVSLIKTATDKKITFDLSGCTMIDSAALGMFVIASDEASVKDISLFIRGAYGKVKDIMLSVLFDNFYTFED
ncbi:MAG: STAS domain-containing protein [Alphaproteobacteria bacterium]|nr:STAS domain-containing protein [Alphaproteobacteria bacterium]MBQ4084670.1 STAS domain-containing protein [Alphaproteobacteria bacterium]